MDWKIRFKVVCLPQYRPFKKLIPKLSLPKNQMYEAKIEKPTQ